MILVNNPGNWGHIYPPLAHAPWHGVTPTDLVFPFFLFAVGNALALVLPALRAGTSRQFWLRVARRTALIFAIGLLLNASPFVRWDAAGDLVLRQWDTLRIMGVLQRIALCFGAAAAIVWLLPRRGVLAAAALLLAGYWLACVALAGTAADGSVDAYSLQAWFGTAVDRALLGTSHLYRGEGVPFDPEGLASTLPAIAQVLLGWWAGDLLLRHGPGATLVRSLCLRGALLLVAAWAWQQLLQMPFNKKIWTSSYVLLTSGIAWLLLAALVWAVDMHRGAAGPRVRSRSTDQRAAAPGRAASPTAPGGPANAVARLCEAFGRNPLFVFVLSGLVPRVLALLRWQDGSAADGTPLWTSPLPWLYKTAFAGIGRDPRLGSLLFACANLACYALLAWWLDRRRIYIRV